jgi:hypothetical protein
MAWHHDKLFQTDDPNDLDQLGSIATPAFRLSAQGTLRDAHPLDHVAAYDQLFQIFKPFLQRHAERLAMNEKPGGAQRRRKSIQSIDWQPFHHLKNVVPYDDRWFVGFDFKSGTTKQLMGRGPTGFRCRVDKTVQIDATISIPDFESGALDVEALKTTLLQLPLRTAVAGFGMATSAYFDTRNYPLALLLPVAQKYPVLDVCPSPQRSWFSTNDDSFNHSWISGINWLTLVGEPFVSALGGVSALVNGVPPEVKTTVSRKTVLFQLGDRPITGQHNEDDALLPLYHTIGRKLQPRGDGCPSDKHPRRPVFGDNTDLSLMWERRFYDGKWFAAGSI